MRKLMRISRFFAAAVLVLAMTASLASAEPRGGELAQPQNITVKGTVVDETNAPMIGVAVSVEGTTVGTTTDITGSFSINASRGATLVFSFLGYEDQKVVVADSRVNIKMTPSNSVLDEVVVIGYGTVKRRDLTGSVASVSGEKLAAYPVANVAQALQGQLPGVSITSEDGRPGATISIRVRGGGSITQSNEPLYIVDGVQVSGIDDIPADNIESIDVLKDAASTAIYGARGANGVILITTKGGKGMDGKVTVRYNGYYQVKTNPEVLETMNAYDYVLGTWSYAKAYGSSYYEGVGKYYGLGAANGNHIEEYRNVKAHNWINDVMRTAGSHNHDLSLSGATDKSHYYASVNLTDDEGIRIKSGYRRWNANFKFDTQINKKLKVDFDFRYSDIRVDGAKFDMATSAYGYHPIDTVLGDPSYTNGLGQGDSNVQAGQDPVSKINNYTYIFELQRMRAKTGLQWNIIDGLTARSELSLSRNWSKTRNWDAGTTASENSYSTAKLTNKDGYGVRWATTLNYEVKGLGENHSLSILVGHELLSSKSNTSEIQGTGYPKGFTMDQAFGMLNMTGGQKDLFSGSVGMPNHTNSFFARANYSLLGRYLFTATFRADGSSKFAPNNRWGYFPAGAIAWRLSDEAFLKDAAWLDNLKLRLSFGTSGSDGIDSSLWRETWKSTTIQVDGETIPIYKPGDMQPNPDLKWETSLSRNLGIDFGFLKNRIRGSIDAYWNTTKDILMKVPTNSSSGYSYQFRNVGQTSNKGIEVALGADLVRKKDFNLSLNITYNYNKNKIDEIRADVDADVSSGWASSMQRPAKDYIIREGQPVGLVQGMISKGFYTVDDFDFTDGQWVLREGVPDIDAGVINFASDLMKSMKRPEGQFAIPGMPKYADTDHNGTVTVDDVDIIGDMQAHHTGGFTLNASWKGIDLTANFTYQIGGLVYNANAAHSMFGNKDTSFGQNRLAFVADAWKYYYVDNAGDLALADTPDKLREINAGTRYPSYYSEYGVVSSDFLEDASYLRLGTLTLGYTLPQKWTKKIGINRARIYFTGGNLFCIAGYSGLDPDVNTKRGGVDGFPTPNYDRNAYPKARTYTFGVNLTF